jgi:hypothetical protein
MPGKKSEYSEMTARIAALKLQVEDITRSIRRLREPEITPLLTKIRQLRKIDDPARRLAMLEIDYLTKKRAAKRAELVFCKFQLKHNQLRLGLSPEEAAAPAQDLTPLFCGVPVALPVQGEGRR